MSALNKSQIQQVYCRRAKNYNFTANLYYAIGFREFAYRRKAVRALNLREGNTVVEISCGTGLNFAYLQEAVGPEGRIIGVDLTAAMLEQAQRRVEQHHWKNIELVHCDAARYRFPEAFSGIISTFAITLIPEYDEIIKNGADALKPNGRWVVLDFKLPSNIFSFLAPLGVAITKPFGVSLDLANHHPWESIERYMHNLIVEELYGGFAYIAEGSKVTA
ncbi:MAG: class I SAM-dependent methyltransferase [Bacteroidota bacterium]|nr:class I SAM-dependent methyltransferase [Bacteroidota bacterium]